MDDNLPEYILAERGERILLIVAKYLKDNWLAFNVFNKGFGDLNCNL